MDKFPLLLEGRPVGELITEREALYTWFDIRCRLPEKGLWQAWAVGDQGELRLGVPEPAEGRTALRRRFSRRMTEPLGRLLRGELRPAGSVPVSAGSRNPWQSAPQPESLFQSPPWPRQRLRGQQDALCRRENGLLFLALPYDSSKPFPLTCLFCFASVRTIQGSPYAVFAFGPGEEPVFY